MVVQDLSNKPIYQGVGQPHQNLNKKEKEAINKSMIGSFDKKAEHSILSLMRRITSSDRISDLLRGEETAWFIGLELKTYWKMIATLNISNHR